MAQRALNGQGEVICGLVPDLPHVPGPADGALMLDMMHFFSDDDLDLAFSRLNKSLADRKPV